MKDIGLGIIDKYTISIVIIIFALAYTIGLTIPLDTSNATQAFFSLVIFTGYLYLTRTIFRLPVAIPVAFAVIAERFSWILPYLINLSTATLFIDKRKKLLAWGMVIVFSFLYVLMPPLFFFLVLADFGEPNFSELYPSPAIENIQTVPNFHIFLAFLAILDRASIVIITLIALLPSINLIIQIIGFVGAIFMVFLYIFKGNFTALLTDGLGKMKEKIKEIQKQQASDTTPQPPNYSPTHELRLESEKIKITNCRICQKVCSEDGFGNLPEFCSLECRQKWYVSWDKDWCIGDGKERELINGLRASGYAFHNEIDSAINQLKDLSGLKAIWTFLAIIRDTDGDSLSSNQISNISEALFEICKRELLNGQLALNIALLDKSKYVTKISADLIVKLPELKAYFEPKAIALLKHEDEEIRLSAIQILGKLYRTEKMIFEHCEIGTSREIATFLDILKEKGEVAIPMLHRFQQSPIPRIREDAIKILREMGIDAQEPDMVINNIKCPKCKKHFRVTYRTVYEVKSVVIRGFFDKWLYQAYISRECQYCHTKLSLIRDQVMEQYVNWKPPENPELLSMKTTGPDGSGSY